MASIRFKEFLREWEERNCSISEPWIGFGSGFRSAQFDRVLNSNYQNKGAGMRRRRSVIAALPETVFSLKFSVFSDGSAPYVVRVNFELLRIPGFGRYRKVSEGWKNFG